MSQTQSSHTPLPVQRQGTHPMVFVISAFLIGLGLGDAAVVPQIPMILAGGACGVITFLFLDSSNRREMSQQQTMAMQKAEEQMASRLNRHMTPVMEIQRPKMIKPPYHARSERSSTLIRSPLSLKNHRAPLRGS